MSGVYCSLHSWQDAKLAAEGLLRATEPALVRMVRRHNCERITSIHEHRIDHEVTKLSRRHVTKPVRTAFCWGVRPKQPPMPPRRRVVVVVVTVVPGACEGESP